MVPLGNGVFRIEQPDGSHALAYAAAHGSSTWVFADGQTYVVDERSGHASRHGSSSGPDASALAAPMPATVTLVHVVVGQQVRSGDVLVTLEAMKMELAIRANIEGTVTAINCRPGELVEPGVPLVELV